MIKSELIYYLHAIATYNSLTLAAENLYMTQPALSIAIKKFENTLGIPLTQKINNRIALTDEAKKILEICNPVLKCLNEVELYINNQTYIKDDSLITLSFSNNAAIVLAPQIVANINTMNDKLSIVLNSKNTNQDVIDYVLSSQKTIGVLFVQDSMDLSSLPNYGKLVTDKIYLKVNKSCKYFSDTTTSISSANIKDIPLILLPGPAVDSLLKLIQNHNEPNILCYAPNLAIMDSYISANLAIGTCIGFNRRTISQNMQDQFRFIEISDAEHTSIIIFSSLDVSKEIIKKIANIIQLSLGTI